MTTKMNDQSGSEEDKKPFVGFCRLEIVDSDGLPKRVNGSHYQVPIHKVESNGKIEFVALFPPQDPVHLLRLASDPTDILTAVWWHGPPVKPHDYVPESKVFAVLESCHCSRKLVEAEKGGGEKFLANAFCEFVSECFNKPLQVEFSIKEIKLQTRVTKAVLRMDKEMFDEWNSYYNVLKEFDKDKKDKDKDNDKESKDDATEKSQG